MLSGHLAAAALGTLDARFTLPGADLALDPVRPRMYVTISGSDEVAVIDTNTLALVQVIPVGSFPVGLSVSADGSRLYVANAGSTSAGIGVVDLTTLTLLPGLPVPYPVADVAAGSNGNIYGGASPNAEAPDAVVEVGTNGVMESTFGTFFFGGAILAMSPDRNTLYAGGVSSSPADLVSFDVTSGSGVQLQASQSTTWSDGEDIEVSHSGSFLSFVCESGQGSFSIFQFPSNNFTTPIGTFSPGKYPYNIAFSPDDAYAYSLPETPPGTQQKVYVFNTSTAAISGTFASPNFATRLKVDSSGKYLFETTIDPNYHVANGISIYDTGRAAAVITSATSATAVVGSPFSYQIAATNSPLSFGATGLPPGLSVDSGSGIISGTATAPGQSQIVISASNAIGVAMAYLTLTAGTPPTLPLTLAINGNGSVINGSPALNNKLQAGSTNLPAGSFVSLTATASPGYAFAGWSGGVTSTVNPLNFLIQTATSIQANFIPATLGAIDATFNLPVSRFALDPVRPRMYATVTASNSVAVIDTSTLSLVQLIPTGASPIGLAVSPDGSRLYVANSGSTTNGVTVIDLTTLSVLSSLSVPNAPYEIVLGAGGMLYLSCETIPNGISPYGLMQITTGGTLVSQSIAVETISSGCELGISPDLNTLYFGSGDAIGTFDVSTGTPVQSQYYDGLQEGGDDLEVSHSGASVAYPCIQNTLIEGVPDIPSSDLTKINGICMCGDNGVNAAFSPDDSIIYTQPVTSGTMLVYGTNPFSGVGSFKVTGDASRLKTDSSGKYLFASVFNYGSETPVSIKVYDTGRPAAVITSATASFTQTGATYNYQIAATNNPTSFGATGLPAGLTVDPATGIISGTTTIPGDSQAIISASNAIGIAMADLNINVFGSGTTAALTVSVSGSGTVQSAYLGTTYPTLGSTISLSATAASGYYFSGWTGGITSAANPLTFVIETATAVQANFLPTPFALTSATENGLDYGNSFTYQIVAPGAGPFTYGATGLPAGLTVDPATGLISGTLADAGNFDVLLTATNGIGAPGSGLLSLQVNAILTVNGSVGGITSPTGTSYSARGASASIQAFPLAGYLFQDWTGPFTSASNPLVFSMPAAADWTANFVPSSIYKGNYAGLFVAGTPGVESSGYLSITLGRSGNFTGSLVLGGAQYKIAGTFAPGDTALITLHRAGQSPITINLTLDLSGSTPLVTGTASDGTWTSVLSTSIEPVLSIRDPSLLAGAYTAALNASTQSLTVPAGSGYATVTVSDAGLAQIAGSLADGTPFSTSATIQADGTLPVYCPLYGRKGGIEGVLAFDSASSPVSLSGTLNWWKPQTTARLYPAAFATTLDVAGSGYARAAGLPGTSGTLSIIGGGLNPDIGQPFTLNSAHGVVIAAQSVHPVKFTLGLNTGVFTGSFYEGATKETFHGVILQNQDSGAGFFLDSTASGQVGLSVSP